MKRIILLIVFGVSSIYANCQNLENLDKKFGVNIFKLDSPFSQYSSNCTYELTSKEGVKYYYYKKPINVKIYNFFADSVLLGFYKNKLYTISIDLMLVMTMTDSDFNSLLKNLEGMFGKGKSSPTDEMIEIGYFWKTSKTYLGLQKISCSSNYKPCITNIYLISNSIKEQIQSDGF